MFSLLLFLFTFLFFFFNICCFFFCYNQFQKEHRHVADAIVPPITRFLPTHGLLSIYHHILHETGVFPRDKRRLVSKFERIFFCEVSYPVWSSDSSEIILAKLIYIVSFADTWLRNFPRLKSNINSYHFFLLLLTILKSISNIFLLVIDAAFRQSIVK